MIWHRRAGTSLSVRESVKDRNSVMQFTKRGLPVYRVTNGTIEGYVKDARSKITRSCYAFAVEGLKVAGC